MYFNSNLTNVVLTFIILLYEILNSYVQRNHTILHYYSILLQNIWYNLYSIILYIVDFSIKENLVNRRICP